MNRRAYVLNGPNLNLLGTREPHIYGSTTLAQVREHCEKHGAKIGVDISFFQSNHEGALVDLIQEARDKADAIIFNPAGYSFHSVAILDALKTFDGPIIEVHISNVHKREEFRHHSFVSKRADGVIAGFGTQGYLLGLRRVAKLLDEKKA